MTKKNKCFIYVFAALFLLLSIFAFFCRTFVFSSVTVYSEKGAENGSLVPLNFTAKTSYVSGNSTAFLRFTEVHKLLLKNTFSENKNASVILRLSAKIPSELSDELPCYIGFIDKTDFSGKGTLQFSSENHPLVSVDFNSLSEVKESLMKNSSSITFDVSFALPMDKKNSLLNQKEGIFIQSSIPVKIKSVKVSKAVTGFDRSGPVPFYGFSSNGGTLDFSATSFDFTGSSNIFPMTFTKSSVLPEITIKMKPNGENFSFSFGGERIRVKRLEETTISGMALKNVFSNVELMDNKESVTALLMGSGSTSILNGDSKYSVTPVLSDPGLITGWPQNNWRCMDYELFQWDRFPNILFFDTKNYAVQSAFFARIAFFIEKEGYRGKLLTNEELFGKHDYNAHDYSAESLAKFFNKAYITNFRLNTEEEVLLEILIKNGMLERVDDPVKPYVSKGGAVLSISREIPSYNRISLLAHEGWHTLFFTDEEFRNYVTAVYNVMDPFSRAFLIDYFKSQPSLGYDVNDEVLMQNEFMAYILQNTENHASEYFVKRASWESVRKYTPELAKYVINTNGSGFDDCGKMLGEFVSDKYNLVSGNIGLVSY